MRYLAVTITGINLAGNKRLKTSLQNNVYPDICNAENHSELTYCDFRNTLLRKPGSNVKNSKCGACLFDERSE